MRLLLLSIPIALLCSCGPPDSPDDTDRTAAPPESRSDWIRIDDSLVVSLPEDAASDEELIRATDEAHVAAIQAREDWRNSPPEERTRWAIKWAAPTFDDRIEYVWVCPVSWTEHRIEGILANPPQNELACARTMGERVSFSAAQMTDWLHYLTDDPTGPFEGGYTVKVLAKRFGTP
jgi:uncharacterized protein YegJ (DUF2314 family)